MSSADDLLNSNEPYQSEHTYEDLKTTNSNMLSQWRNISG